jgi:hypothetical protein
VNIKRSLGKIAGVGRHCCLLYVFVNLQLPYRTCGMACKPLLRVQVAASAAATELAWYHELAASSMQHGPYAATTAAKYNKQ